VSIESVIQADTNGNVRLVEPSPAAPGIPGELWMLWSRLDDGDGPMGWINEIYFNEGEAAEQAWEHNKDGLDCYPVRVK
jgi:hypothetical protein